MTRGSARPDLPATILSGFLGSGKTTLLNNLLAGAPGFRIAVLVNDFGDLSIDRDLVTGAEDGVVVDLPGGCACCEIRQDLLSSLLSLLRSGREFDCLVMEASGLASPGAVVQTFAAPAIAARLRLDAVITMVDAENFPGWVDTQPVATEQVACADLLVLNKTDLVDAATVAGLRARLAAINPQATILEASWGRLPTEVLLDTSGFEPHAPRNVAIRHGHDPRMAAVSFSGHGRMDFAALQRFVETLPEEVVRAKGIVAVEGLEREVIFHRVGKRSTFDQGQVSSGPQSLRAVFIGTGFDSTAVLAGMQACQLQDA